MTHSVAPRLEMLWEADDPAEALMARFGFADAVSAGRWVVAVLDQHWALQVVACERIVISDRNAIAWVRTPSGPLVAKWSASPEIFRRLSGLAHLTLWLDGQGLPVSTPVEATRGHLQVEIDAVSMGLQRVIPGDLLDSTDLEQVTAAGVVLARLHESLAAYPDADQIVPSTTRPQPLAARITGWLDSDGSAEVPAGVGATLRRLVAEAPAQAVATQLVHGDFRSANVLCAGIEIAAVLDFEEIRRDHCIVEVARSAVLLGTRFHDWGPVSAEVRATFLAGYESFRPLTPVEAGWWDVLVLWFTAALMPPGDDPAGWGRSAQRQLATLHRDSRR